MTCARKPSTTPALPGLIKLGLLGLIYMGSGIASAVAETQVIEFTGQAFDAGTRELLYTEAHRLEQENGVPIQETVQYMTPDGKRLALKEMIYREPARPAYRLTVTTPNRLEVVEPGDGGVSIESVESGTLKWSDNAPNVIDGGFHYFILEHFNTLLAGDRVDFQFLAPTRVRWLGLRVQPDGQEAGQLNLELTVQNRLLSLVISSIELSYDIETRRLLRYRGLTNLPKPGGGNYTANIEYKYNESNEP